MKYLLRIFLLNVALFALSSCSDSSSSSRTSEEMKMHAEFQSDSLDGFVRVLAKGAMAFLGTDDEKASFSERPRINVEFTYDYSIGRHEVLCSDFNKVMEKETGLKMECKQDSLPVANVTRFDAILFANALSKSLNRDTSYRYTSAEFDDDKHWANLSRQVNLFNLPRNIL